MAGLKPIIGLCGGIGAGKSVAARAFEHLGAVVIDSDRLSHEVMARPEVAAELVRWWGSAVIGSDGQPDRRAIADRVFEDAAEKKRLEGLIYPLIAARRQDIISRSLEDQAVRAIILDSPLLFESNLDRLCDAVVFVDASPQTRQQRLRDGRAWGPEQLRQRERWQIPVDQKRARAQYVLPNDGSLDDLQAQAAELFDRILARGPSSR